MDNEKMVESVIKAQGEDGNAFAELFLSYKDSTYYIAKKMFADENKSLNIVYETAISVFRQIKTLNPASVFPLWLNMISGSVCKKRLTKQEQAKFAPSEGDKGLIGEVEDANAKISREAFDNNETKSMICSIADSLPSDQKLCAIMYYFGGLKIEYIAQSLGTTPIVVKNAIFSATNKIKEGMYGFVSKGEKLYAVPAWLIAASFVAQSKLANINNATAQQIFGAASQNVFGAPIVAAAFSQAKQPVAQENVKQHKQVEEQPQHSKIGEKDPAPSLDNAYESVSFDKIKERDYDRFENSDSDDDDDKDYKKKKKTSNKKSDSGKKSFFKRPFGIILIVVLVIAILAAAAIFALPKLTDGKIDPLAMISSLFSNPEKDLIKADEFIAAGDFAAAAEILEKLVEKDATNSALYLKLITCYEQLGDNAKLIGSYKNYYTLVPRQNDLEMYQKYIAIAPDEPIVWADEALGNMVAQALGSDAVTPNSLANVSDLVLVGNSKAYTDIMSYAQDLDVGVEIRKDANEKYSGYSYNGEEKGIAAFSTFADLLNFGNLKSLVLNFVSYGDLETILKLKPEIQKLDFIGCELGTVPDLTMLTSLNSLTIAHDSIIDISPVSTLSGLTELSLHFNQIADITALGTLTNLTSLRLDSNKIIDISALTPLTKLTMLNISRNEIKDFDPLDDFDFDDDMLNRKDQFWEPEEVTEG